MTMRELQIVNQGSRIYQFSVPAIVATKTYWYDLPAVMGVQEAALYNFLDSLVILNNSALPIHFYLNSADNDYYILAYGTQPISRRAFRTFGLYNPDAITDIAAGLVTMSMRRLPPDIVSVVNQS